MNRLALLRRLLANGSKRFQQVMIFGNQRDSKRLVREGELVGWRAELDLAAEEAFELRLNRPGFAGGCFV